MDRRADPYEQVVDRLLASPHFGERMALFWLDLVRYADTTGYHGDNHVDLYLYRDYVIRSFNSDKPFDRFTTEQLAGDLIDGATDETRIASGYNRLLQTTQEGGAQAKEYMAKYSADRVRNVSTVWLGTTLGCAECHDHKYDPFSTREFYNLATFFADVKETAVGVQEPTPFPTPAQIESLHRLAERIGRSKAVKTPTATERQDLATLEKRRAALEANPDVLGLYFDPAPSDSGVAQRQLAGRLGADRAARSAGVARLVGGQGSPGIAGRPRSLVGCRRQPPGRSRHGQPALEAGLRPRAGHNARRPGLARHQALAPRAARLAGGEFIESGWKVKAMLKLMVMSETYRQSSHATSEMRLRNPGNRWLAPESVPARCRAGPRQRPGDQRPALERNRRPQRQALSTAGLLDLSQFSQARLRTRQGREPVPAWPLYLLA